LAGLTSTAAALGVVRFLGLPVGPAAAVVATATVGVVYIGMTLMLRLSAEDRSAIDALVKRGSARRDPATETDLAPAESGP
jgi:hypothetical protein